MVFSGQEQMHLASHENDTWTPSGADALTHVIGTLAATSVGDLWVGTLGGGLARLSRGNWTTFKAASSKLPSDVVRSIELAIDGAVWVGTENGLAAC